MRIFVTLDQKVAGELRRIAGPLGRSAFVNQAVRQHLHARRMRELLDEMEQESGPIPDDVRPEIGALGWPA